MDCPSRCIKTQRLKDRGARHLQPIKLYLAIEVYPRESSWSNSDRDIPIVQTPCAFDDTQAGDALTYLGELCNYPTPSVVILLGRPAAAAAALNDPMLAAASKFPVDQLNVGLAAVAEVWIK